jgi:hypothetical protein
MEVATKKAQAIAKKYSLKLSLFVKLSTLIFFSFVGATFLISNYKYGMFIFEQTQLFGSDKLKTRTRIFLKSNF